MQVVGMKPWKYQPEGSEVIYTGITLNVVYPYSANDTEANGYQAERLSVKASVLEQCGKPELKDEITVSYNRFGKVEFINIIGKAK